MSAPPATIPAAPAVTPAPSPGFCNDCGKPAVGLFDLPSYNDKRRRYVHDDSHSKPLCAAHVATRGALPPTAAPGDEPDSDA